MPPPKERENIKVQAERAVLAAVRLPDDVYDQANPFGELASLAEQAGAIVVGELEQRKQKPEPATFIGAGKLNELKGMCAALDAKVVIFDHELAPKQIANIERVVERKVIDRSELILDIFASRATTHEAKLAVELAQLQYTYPRLRAMWDHLERITGAGGIAGIGTRGPGEQQLEIDRRLAQRKRLVLEGELDDIHARKRRMVQERKRDHFTVGIVGYTNAGKSTLFNALTAGGAYADDRLFATLVTRTRDWDLGEGVKVMLSDTVGFVRNLPHHLIASFRATLEEATHADVLLIVLDVSDPAAELQYDTVMGTLDELEAEVGEAEDRAAKKGRADAYTTDRRGSWRPNTEEMAEDASDSSAASGMAATPIEQPKRSGAVSSWQPAMRIVLLNKSDRLEDNRNLLYWMRRIPDAIPISAIQGPPNGLGFPELSKRIAEVARQGMIEAEITLPIADGKTLQRLEARGHIYSREYLDLNVRLRVRIGKRQLDQVLTGTRTTAAALAEAVPPATTRGWGEKSNSANTRDPSRVPDIQIKELPPGTLTQETGSGDPKPAKKRRKAT